MDQENPNYSVFGPGLMRLARKHNMSPKDLVKVVSGEKTMEQVEEERQRLAQEKHKRDAERIAERVRQVGNRNPFREIDEIDVEKFKKDIWQEMEEIIEEKKKNVITTCESSEPVDVTIGITERNKMYPGGTPVRHPGADWKPARQYSYKAIGRRLMHKDEEVRAVMDTYPGISCFDASLLVFLGPLAGIKYHTGDLSRALWKMKSGALEFQREIEKQPALAEEIKLALEAAERETNRWKRWKYQAGQKLRGAKRLPGKLGDFFKAIKNKLQEKLDRFWDKIKQMAAIEEAGEVVGVVGKKTQEKEAYREKFRKAFDIGLEMQRKNLIAQGKVALDQQVDQLMEFDEVALQSFGEAVGSAQPIPFSDKLVRKFNVQEDDE